MNILSRREKPLDAEAEKVLLNANEMLLKENVALKTWVRGLLAGCEGCTNAARAWDEALTQGFLAEEESGVIEESGTVTEIEHLEEVH